MHRLPSKRHHRIAYEFKVSRSDFLHELQQPLKRRRALLLSNEYYFVTPARLVRPEEVPVETGLIEVVAVDGVPRFGMSAQHAIVRDGDQWHTFTVKVPAPWRDTPGPTWQFLSTIARRVARDAARDGQPSPMPIS